MWPLSTDGTTTMQLKLIGMLIYPRTGGESFWLPSQSIDGTTVMMGEGRLIYPRTGVNHASSGRCR